MGDLTAEQIAEHADPGDGYCVIENRLATDEETNRDYEISLHFGFRQDGQLVLTSPAWVVGTEPELTVEAFKAKQPTDADYGRKARLKLLMATLCRFVNTGGTLNDIYDMMAKMGNVCGDVSFIIPGFHLIDSAINEEGVYEHLFAKDGEIMAIRLVEGKFVDAVPLADLQEEAQPEEEPHVIFTEPSTSGPDRLEVQHQGGAGTSAND